MATIEVKAVVSPGANAETIDTGAIEHDTGSALYVIAYGQRNSFTTAFSWAITDDASSNTITWNNEGTSSLFNNIYGSSFGSQMQVWRSSTLTSTETFTITVDPSDASSNSWFRSLVVIQVSGNGLTLAQSSAFQSESNQSTITASYGSAPAGDQLAIFFASIPDTGAFAWDAAPTGWSKSSGGETTSGLVVATVFESTSNTDSNVTASVTTGQEIYNLEGVLLDVADPVAVPAAIADLAADAGDGEVVLTWSAPSANPSIDTYDVERSSTSAVAGFSALATDISPTTTYTDSSAVNGTQYWYRVRATNTEGDAAWSNVATATPAASPYEDIGFIGGDQDDQGINATSLTLTVPTIPADANAFGIVYARLDDDLLTQSISGTPVAGWTELTGSPFRELGGRDRTEQYWYGPLDDGDSGGTITVAISGAQEHSATLHVFSNVDGTTPLDATPVQAGGINAINPATSDITTVTDKAAVVVMLGSTHDDITVAGAPTGYTLGEEIIGGTNDHKGQITAYLLDSGSAGLKSPGSWNNTGSPTNVAEWSTLTWALRPAAKAAGAVELTASISDALSASATGSEVSALGAALADDATGAATGSEVTALSAPLAGSLTATATGSEVTALSGSASDALTATATGTISTGPVELTAAISDALSGSGSGSKVSALSGSGSDALSVSASGSEVGSLGASLGDALSASAAGSKVSEAASSLSGALTASGTGAEVSALSSALSDALSASGTGSVITGLGASLGDALTVLVSGSEVAALASTLADALTATATGTVEGGPVELTASVADALSASGVGAKVSALAAPLAESLSVASTGSKVSALAAPVSDILTGSASGAAVSQFAASPSDALSAVAAGMEVAALGAALADALTATAIGSQIGAPVELSASLADALTAAGLGSAVGALSASIADALAVTGSGSITAALLVAAADSMSATADAAKVSAVASALADSLTGSAAGSEVAALSGSLSDALTVVAYGLGTGPVFADVVDAVLSLSLAEVVVSLTADEILSLSAGRGTIAS